MSFFRRLITLFIVVLLIAIFDLWTKAWAVERLGFSSRPVITGLFGGIDLSFTLVTNTGTAWGLFSNYPGFLTILRILIGIFLCIYYFCSKKLLILGRFGILLILGGACGNLWDIKLRGHVVDFIDFHFWGWHYPVFNIADCAIVLGALIFLFSRGASD